MPLLRQIGKEKWACVLVLLSGNVAGFMLQKNWLYMVQDSTFEKDIFARFLIGTPLIGLLFFALWVVFLKILHPVFSAETFPIVIRRDAFSMLSLLGTVSVMWSPPLSALLFESIAITWVLLKLILYPKALIQAVQYFWKYLTQPIPLTIEFSKNQGQVSISFQGEINERTSILAKEKITRLFEETPITKLTVDLSQLQEITLHTQGILLILQGECLLQETQLVFLPETWHKNIQNAFAPEKDV